MTLASNGHHAAIAYIDANDGKLINEIRSRDVLENTSIIVTADHCGYLGDHNHLNHSNSFYRQLLQLPFMMKYPPALPEGESISAVVSLRDLAATAPDVSGVASEMRLSGFSLAELMGDSTARVSPVEIGRAVVKAANRQTLVSDGMHYIRTMDGKEELYDLERDSLETQSLLSSASRAEMLNDLRVRLDSNSSVLPPVPC